MHSPLQRDLLAWRDSGDDSAAARVIAGLHGQVQRIVANHLPRGTDPSDLIQETFLQLFKTLHRYDFSRPLENWVSRLTLNLCLNALRARSRRPECRWSDLPEDAQRAAETLLQQPDTGSNPKESRELVFHLLQTLEPKDRMIITLLHLEERSLWEISELTGWSSAAIKVRAFRARHRLRKTMQQLLSERPACNQIASRV
jgi:RNA polymerase sigma factor (sigma-70 family)